MSGAYSRVYHSIIDDDRFEGIYDDDRHLATWLRLLLVAEAAWPASAALPRSARGASVKALAEAGIIALRPGDRFRIHGLDPERQRRTDHAQRAARGRWSNAAGNARGNAPGNAQPMLDETRRDEHRRDEHTREDVEAFLLVRHRLPTPAQQRFMDAYLDTFDVTGPQRAERLILANPQDPIGALKADLEAFRAERLAALPPEPKPRPRRSSGLPESTKELLAHWSQQEREASA